MSENASTYNEPSSGIAQDARKIYKFIKDQVKEFKPDIPQKPVLKSNNSTDSNAGLMKSEMKKIIDYLVHYKENGYEIAEIFMDVPSRTDYPDYYQIIKKVICFNQIYSKINSGEFKSLDDFEEATSLIFRNAQTYNLSGSLVYIYSQTLENLFSTKLTKLKGKFPKLVKNNFTEPVEEEEILPPKSSKKSKNKKNPGIKIKLNTLHSKSPEGTKIKLKLRSLRKDDTHEKKQTTPEKEVDLLSPIEVREQEPPVKVKLALKSKNKNHSKLKKHRESVKLKEEIIPVKEDTEVIEPEEVVPTPLEIENKVPDTAEPIAEIVDQPNEIDSINEEIIEVVEEEDEAPTDPNKRSKDKTPLDAYIQEVGISSTRHLTKGHNKINGNSNAVGSMQELFEYRFIADDYIQRSYVLSLHPQSNMISIRTTLNESLLGRPYNFVVSLNHERANPLPNYHYKEGDPSTTLKVQYELRLNPGLNLIEFLIQVAPPIHRGASLPVRQTVQHSIQNQNFTGDSTEFEKYTFWVQATF